METLTTNAGTLGVPLIPLSDIRQGTVHVVGLEQGMRLPRTTIVCVDSHISNGRGLRGAGLRDRHERGRACAGDADPGAAPALDDLDPGGGNLPPGCEAKDLILTLIARIGTAGDTGHVLEYAGSAIHALGVAGRMKVCNMSIEAGACGPGRSRRDGLRLA